MGEAVKGVLSFASGALNMEVWALCDWDALARGFAIPLVLGLTHATVIVSVAALRYVLNKVLVY